MAPILLQTCHEPLETHETSGPSRVSRALYRDRADDAPQERGKIKSVP